jgi:hypothetical protein
MFLLFASLDCYIASDTTMFILDILSLHHHEILLTLLCVNFHQISIGCTISAENFESQCPDFIRHTNFL